MTGRNHTTNGMAGVTEITDGYPNANGHIPRECANIAEVLVERGSNTYAIGKWRLTSEDETNLAASKEAWPLGRGSERFYGFIGATWSTSSPTAFAPKRRAIRPVHPKRERCR